MNLPEGPAAPPRPRSFQFSLRTLVIACLAVGLLTGAHFWAWAPALAELPFRRALVTLVILCDVLLAVGLGLVLTLALVELTLTDKEREILRPWDKNRKPRP